MAFKGSTLGSKTTLLFSQTNALHLYFLKYIVQAIIFILKIVLTRVVASLKCPNSWDKSKVENQQKLESPFLHMNWKLLIFLADIIVTFGRFPTRLRWLKSETHSKWLLPNSCKRLSGSGPKFQGFYDESPLDVWHSLKFEPDNRAAIRRPRQIAYSTRYVKVTVF